MVKTIKANLLWVIMVAALAGYLGFALSGQSEDVFMPGETSHGHHQIEMACSVCHTTGMGVKQEACTQCHAEELERVNDSHPVIKFKDPRNAGRLEKIEATLCVTCHREHQPEITGEMGVTVPMDYCFHCHEKIGEQRPSHEGMGFDTCATAGCHNFHDNSALYERFLAEHLDEPDMLDVQKVKPRTFYEETIYRTDPLTQEDADMPEDIEYTHRIMHDWSTTIHAEAGVNCTDCHNGIDKESGEVVWQAKPNYESCKTCHGNETKGFLEGKHGMRLAQDLTPMTPGMAKIPMNPAAAHQDLSCASCHDSHRFNTVNAAVDSCLECHSDEHSLAYKQSPHYLNTYRPAQLGHAPLEEAVSCATCHMPRVERTKFGETFTMVDHNQNNSLRPNDKMIRSSCIQCHGLQFTLNSLADEDLIRRNFKGRPSVFVDSLELAREEKLKSEAAKAAKEE